LLGIFGWIISFPPAALTNIVINKIFPNLPLETLRLIVLWIVFSMISMAIAEKYGYRYEPSLQQDQRGYYY
jgi:hypothetical protein